MEHFQSSGSTLSGIVRQIYDIQIYMEHNLWSGEHKNHLLPLHLSDLPVNLALSAWIVFHGKDTSCREAQNVTNIEDTPRQYEKPWQQLRLSAHGGKRK